MIYRIVYWKRYVKDTFWKQFTTIFEKLMQMPVLKTICQRYILKAIHNHAPVLSIALLDWKRYVKDTFWKQFTTMVVLMFTPSTLKTICQRYILKAIHNKLVEDNKKFIIENDMSKIHFESNSQHYHQALRNDGYWKRYVKDTFWKQFTTK